MDANSSLYGIAFLYMGYNNLSGMVLKSLAQLSTLQQLELASNSFTGRLTEAHFANLRRFEDLDLSYNSFEVILNHYWNPPFNAQSVGMCSSFGTEISYLASNPDKFEQAAVLRK